jgi:hypothetical protein
MIGVLIGLLLAGGVGAGIYFLTKGSSANNGTLTPNSRSSSTTSNPSTPTEVWKALYAAASRRDVAAMKELLSKAALDEVARPRGKMSDDENLSQIREFISTSFTSEIGDEEITRDGATVEIRASTGEWGKAGFVKEDGSWKFAGILQRASAISNTNTPKK